VTIDQAAQRTKVKKVGLKSKLMNSIGVTIVIQIVLTSVLLGLSAAADIRAIHFGHARDNSAAARDVITRSQTIVGYCEQSMRKNLKVDYDCEKDRVQMKIWSERLKGVTEMPQLGQTAGEISDEAEELAAYIKKICVHNRLVELGEKQALENPNMRPATGTANSKPITVPDVRANVMQLEDRILANQAKLRELEQHYYSVMVSQKFAIEDTIYTATVIGVLINMIVLASQGFYLSRDIIARLALVHENVKQIERRGRLLPQISGTDEIASLDRTFHELAAMMQQAEDQERALFEHSSNFLCAIDVGRRFLEVNQASTKILGYRPEELIGKPIETFVSPAEKVSVVGLLQTVVTGKRREPFELTLLKRDGQQVETLWTTSVTPDGDKIFCVLHNISERKIAQRLRKEMVQMVSHDLRSPLNSLAVVYSMIKDGRFGVLNEKGQRFLRAAEANASRMLLLINDLLDIEKLEAGMVQLERKLTPLSPLLEQAIDSVLPLANQKQINLTNNQTSKDLVVSADPNRMMQVLVNLLSNAIKFSPQGGNVSVSAFRQQNSVEISVTDQGRGIPKELLKDVFNRFQQVQRGDATEKGGSGLGLAICRSLIELHGGDISVNSEEGIGSVFRVRLPM
jgi:PAS domain S-box-containing protein